MECGGGIAVALAFDDPVCPSGLSQAECFTAKASQASAHVPPEEFVPAGVATPTYSWTGLHLRLG